MPGPGAAAGPDSRCPRAPSIPWLRTVSGRGCRWSSPRPTWGPCRLRPLPHLGLKILNTAPGRRAGGRWGRPCIVLPQPSRSCILGAEWLDPAPGLWGAGARGSAEFPGALSRTRSGGSVPHALTPALGHLCFLGLILGGCCLGAPWAEPLGRSCVKSGPWWRSRPRHPGRGVVVGACWAREGRQNSHVACSHGWGCPRGPR